MAFIVKGQGQIYLASETGSTAVVYAILIVQGLNQLKSVNTYYGRSKVLKKYLNF